MSQWLNMSAKYRLSVPFFYFWPKLMHLAARSNCDICTPIMTGVPLFNALFFSYLCKHRHKSYQKVDYLDFDYIFIADNIGLDINI